MSNFIDASSSPVLFPGFDFPLNSFGICAILRLGKIEERIFWFSLLSALSNLSCSTFRSASVGTTFAFTNSSINSLVISLRLGSLWSKMPRK